MARTPSNMIELGSDLPNFNLINTINNELFDSEVLNLNLGTLVMFICNHCPFVVHVLDEISSISNFYKGKINIVAISSNDVDNYPQDSPEMMKKLASNRKFNFPYLYDENQEVAKNYNAVCTPDFYGFDKNLKLKYRGRIDSGIMNSEKNNHIERELFNAMINIKDKGIGPSKQFNSIGCSIKWK